MVENIILLGGEAKTGLSLFSFQESVLKPTCQEEKMNRFPPAYGISTGAPIMQFAAAALFTDRKQLILIASCHGALNLDPWQQRREDSFTTSYILFCILLLWHMKTSSSMSLAASTTCSLCSETERFLPLGNWLPDAASPHCWSGLRC